MTALMEFTTDSGATVTVEVAQDAPGARPVSRSNSLTQASRTFDAALQGIRSAAESALTVFRDGSLRPDAVELEFGVKIMAEAGAVISKTAGEGHLTVKLSWNPGAQGATDPEQGSGAAAPTPPPAPAPAPAGDTRAAGDQ